MADGSRNVDLVIRARDETQRALQTAHNALTAFAQAQVRTARYRGLVDAQRDTAAAAASAAKELRAAGLAASGEQVRGFRAAAAAARNAKDQLAAYKRELAGVTSQRGSFAAFDAVATGRPGGAPLANALPAMGGAGRGGRGALGLRPHELTNLGYQINDLVTQIASGTSPLQAFAQQGGQIAQIFPSATGALLRMVPAIAAVTGVAAPFVAAFARVQGLEADLRRFQRQLTITADAGAYSAAELARTAQRLDQIGLSAGDARTAVETFTRQSLNPALFESFGRAARDLARITGREVPAASELLSEGLTGNYEDFRRLDSALNVVSKAERARIRDLFEAGKAEEARRLAVGLTFRRLSDGAAQMDGPWSQAGRNLGNAWNQMLDQIGNWPVIQGTIRLIDQLAQSVARLTAQLPGATAAGQAAARRSEIQRLESGMALNRAARGRAGNTSSFGGPSASELDRDYDRSRRRLLQLRYEEARAANAATGLYERGGVVLATEREAKAAEDAALRDAERAARDSERRAEQQREFVAGLAAENAERLFQVSLLDETERQQEILTALRKAEQEAADVGLSLTAAQRREIEATTGALYDAQIALKATETIERTRLDLAQRRGEVETEAAFVARRLAEETADWTEAQRQAFAALVREQYRLEEGARRREAAESNVNRLYGLRREILTQIDGARGRGEDVRAAELQTRLQTVNGELRSAIAGAIAFWTTLGGPEAEAAVLALQGLDSEVAEIGKNLRVTSAELEGVIGNGALDAFDNLTRSLAEGQNLFGALRDSFLQFASDFLRQIAAMIAQQALLNAISGMFGGGQGGGVGGFLVRAINAGAPRFHTGGIVGLRPDEVPIIAQRGEEVLTAADPRHRNNGGLGGTPVNLTAVNVFDAEDFLDRALSGEGGSRILINWLNRNSTDVRTVIG